MQQACSSELAASLQFAICSKPAVHNLQQVCSSQFAASLQFTICTKSAVRNLQQVCSSQLAASLLTTCSRLVVIKPEQAMRTHPDIGLMIATCSKSAADLLQLARFWLCIRSPLVNNKCLFSANPCALRHFPKDICSRVNRHLFAMPTIGRRCGHLYIRTLLSYNIVVSRACAATHKKYKPKGKWQHFIFSFVRDSRTVYRSLLQNFNICFTV